MQFAFWNEARVQGALCKNIYLAGLLRRCIYLRYYKPHSLLKVKGDMVKTGCFEKRLQWRVPFFFWMKERYLVFECFGILLESHYLSEILHTS